ncbi:MAG: hypothetical protein LBR22_04880 [Desulfovibrio sp.]|jgi:hypothetical protein|nr:hypothetical protein [Desulfovibrio sp.]
MSTAQVVEHRVAPYFEIEPFMVMSQETRLGGASLERLANLWEAWVPLLRVCEVKTGDASHLAVWLPESVEADVDGTWVQSPSEGWLHNNLARYLCMSAIQELLPEVEEGGCAPAPDPTPELREALAAQGLPYKTNADTLALRYAMVTNYPYRGGCEICHLLPQCPKGRGDGELGIVLPGHEREPDGSEK